MTQHSARYVLVGGGRASAAAAETIRRYDLKGGILIAGSEPHLPYHRPLLSKEYLRGEAAEDALPIHPEDWYKQNEITLLTGTKATGANTKMKIVTLENGDTVSFEKLLIGTGAVPKPLDVPGAGGPNVHALRTREDSDALRAKLGEKIILIGGDYIGVEAVSSFLAKGGQAVIVEPTRHLWSRFASPEYGAFLQKKLEAAGAEVIIGDEAAEITAAGVKTKAGREIDGGIVLVGMGVKPNLEFARASGVDTDENNGVLVSEFLLASAPDVYAAGDAAGFRDPAFGSRRRVGHWDNARRQGEIAGANMAGQKIADDHVPSFSSDALGLHIEMFGDPQGGCGGLFHGDPDTSRFDELYVDENNRVVMVISVNPPPELYETLQKLPRVRPDVDDLKDEIRSADFDLDLLLALD